MPQQDIQTVLRHLMNHSLGAPLQDPQIELEVVSSDFLGRQFDLKCAERKIKADKRDFDKRKDKVLIGYVRVDQSGIMCEIQSSTSNH